MYVCLKVTDGGSGAENDPLLDIRLTAFLSDKDTYNAVVTITATATATDDGDGTAAQSAKATMKVLATDVNGDGHQDR